METDAAVKPLTMDDVTREVGKIKNMLAEAVEEGMHQATRGLKRGRYAAEDALEEARHSVKQSPLEAVGIAFAAGIVVGGVACWLLHRTR